MVFQVREAFEVEQTIRSDPSKKKGSWKSFEQLVANPILPIGNNFSNLFRRKKNINVYNLIPVPHVFLPRAISSPSCFSTLPYR